MANNTTFPGDFHRYPTDFRQWNRSHAGAYKKGVKAFYLGDGRNPYGDQRTWHGGVTWARAYWRAWQQGFEDAQEQSR